MQTQKRRLKKDFHFIIGMQRDEGNVWKGEVGRGIEVCVGTVRCRKAKEQLDGKEKTLETSLLSSH